MAEYRRGAHTVFEIHLHLVWITKYRRPALQGEVATRVRDLDPGHRRTARDIDHERSCVEGSRASVDLAAAAGDDQSLDAMAKREDGAPSACRVSTPEEAVLGATRMGTGLLLLQFR